MSREISAPESERPTAGRGHRAIWKGTLGFGLVSIPVKLQRAVQKKGVRFHEIHDADGGRIRHRAVCSHDGAAVPREHIVHGFELERGHHVHIAPAELSALSPAASRLIDIDAFVDLAEIDPIFYDRTYWVVPGEGGERAYTLLLGTLSALRKVAVARMVLRSRQVVCVVRPAGAHGRRSEALALSVLDYADEILPVAGLEGLPGAEVHAQIGERERLLAERLVEARSGHFQPERYHDEHRDKILALIHRKAGGEAPTPEPARPTAPPQLDLVGALEASLTEAAHRKDAA